MEDAAIALLGEVVACLGAVTSGSLARRVDIGDYPEPLHRFVDDINRGIDGVVALFSRNEPESVDGFRRDMNIISQNLGMVADSMGADGRELVDAMQIMEGRVRTTEEEAERVRHSMACASDAVDSIGDSISDVAGQVRGVSRMTGRAVAQMEETRDAIMRLEQASSKIGSMIGLITKIARQTQMLAMNATIEAARAGKAGRGFAVVASEVKGLAAQTSGVAQDISATIEEVRTTTETTTSVIQTVTETIGSIDRVMADIERSASEQECSAAGISDNVLQASRAATAMRGDLADVRQAVDTTNRNVATMNHATQQLRHSIDELNAAVGSHAGASTDADDIELF